MTLCGFELEVSDGAASVLGSLQAQRLTSHARLHPYHCGCADCRPSPYCAGHLFKAQEDCTADGEFITGILEYGSPDFERAVNGIGRALLTTGAKCEANVGNHVHVNRDDLTGEDNARLCRLWDRYADELFEIAAGPRGAVRNYNGNHRRAGATNLWTVNSVRNSYDVLDHTSHLLAWKSHTVEFRLWNSVRAPWRIRTHVGLSVAFVQAAQGGADCTRNDPRCLEEVIGDFIDAPTWSGILRQRYSKGGLAV